MTADVSPQPIPAPLTRRLVAEFLGTALLVAIVVGSGIAASELSPNDVGLQLLQNSIATTLGLAVLIAVLGPLSGAHFNPVVSLADWWLSRRSGQPGFSARDVAPYAVAQVLGAIVGALLANAMFDVPAAISSTERAAPGTLLAEIVATAGLVLVIFALVRSGNARIIPAAVGAYIGAAYWFTSSTSFANPAVTVGRIFSDTFAGIAPASVAPFLGAQLVGGFLGVLLVSFLFPTAVAAAEPVRTKVSVAVAKS
ncbi:aquaporin family protein [Agromyces badenianii]|uniref:Aquaporin family protein n=1 Tax=Agromyces badenianii TaxID=2080742 RepID=A0A2S0WSQ5_9MICO|nr:MIP/aquaporin family protein [Agromyces badenianii]AWB94321.1 aquaporin family protein [Agromyces badenianii]PWC05682.1 aquaporin family protein [Agromyces badenianii]